MAEGTNLVYHLRQAMEEFLAARLAVKTEKLAPDDPARAQWEDKFSLPVWLADAARRVAWIQAATHTIKAVHPSARGTNLFCPPRSLPSHELVGSHLLGDTFRSDVVGNAAALDVNKFLTVECLGKTLLQWMQEERVAVVQAMGGGDAETWVDAFLGFVRQPETLESHTLGKQLYWLTGSDSSRDEDFVLLAPLYASSLVHVVYEEIQEHRFGDAAKEARKARKEKLYSEHAVHDYPGLAVQKLGGTKPQNVSQLNSERGGTNYLLASCPPVWRSQRARPIFGRKSAFQIFEKKPDVREYVQKLKKFLEENPDPIMSTRNRCDKLVFGIMAEIRQCVEEILSLPPGWSLDRRCRLADEERCWLDPVGTATDPDFADLWEFMGWAPEVERRFGIWLNDQLAEKLPMGDPEHRYWVKLFDDNYWRQFLKDTQLRVEEASHA
ncbi:MAG: type I-F CRISPR-associated protein Csy1 [Pseudomonadota bacterium]|nr:type I-F CRISPR-associated protein Csy1 [Pseudomonadota bacterium]